MLRLELIVFSALEMKHSSVIYVFFQPSVCYNLLGNINKRFWQCFFASCFSWLDPGLMSQSEKALIFTICLHQPRCKDKRMSHAVLTQSWRSSPLPQEELPLLIVTQWFSLHPTNISHKAFALARLYKIDFSYNLFESLFLWSYERMFFLAWKIPQKKGQ